MSDFERALVEELARLADNSMRDGQQSLDKNRVPGVLTVTTMPYYERFVRAILDTAAANGVENFEVPGYEFWGGGEVGQPAWVLGENPLETLKAIAALGKSVRVKALYRGRQGYGFEPIHDDTQQAALRESMDDGVSDLRIFDMMNEWQNLQKADGFAIEEAQRHDGVKILGCVCYTKPTPEGEMSWTPEELAELAVKHAQAGVDIVEIKDYAGNLWSNKEAREWMGDDWEKVSAAHVVRTIREALDQAGFENVPLHLHSHGQKPEALDEALDAGAEVVDVGIGVQSGRYTDPKTGGEVENTLAFTNIRDILAIRMAKRGFDINDEQYADHEILQRVGELEGAIEFACEPIMNDRREALSIMAKIPREEFRYGCMAGGATSALWGLVAKQWAAPSMRAQADAKITPEGIAAAKEAGLLPDRINKAQDVTQEVHFIMAFRLAEKLWLQGGTFATVTPGAKICCEQAAIQALGILQGGEAKYNTDFVNVVIGRFGRNTGLDKGIGDTGLRETLLDGQEPALFPPKEGSGLDRAEAVVERIPVEFGEGAVPTKEAATLLAALTTKGGFHDIVEALLHYLQTGERTGSIEPSRTPFDAARTTDEMILVAEALDATNSRLIEYTALEAAKGLQVAGPITFGGGDIFAQAKGRALEKVRVALTTSDLPEAKVEQTLQVLVKVLDNAIREIDERRRNLNSTLSIQGPGRATVPLEDVVGIEAIEVATLQASSDPDKEAKIRELTKQAVVKIKNIGVAAAQERIIELTHNVTTGEFNERQVQRLQDRLDDLELHGEAALDPDNTPGWKRGKNTPWEGDGDVESRIVTLRKKIRTRKLDESDIRDRRERLEAIETKIGTFEHTYEDMPAKVRSNATTAFETLVDVALGKPVNRQYTLPRPKWAGAVAEERAGFRPSFRMTLQNPRVREAVEFLQEIAEKEIRDIVKRLLRLHTLEELPTEERGRYGKEMVHLGNEIEGLHGTILARAENNERSENFKFEGLSILPVILRDFTTKLAVAWRQGKTASDVIGQSEGEARSP